jgi:hypothetical protein
MMTPDELDLYEAETRRRRAILEEIAALLALPLPPECPELARAKREVGECVQGVLRGLGWLNLPWVESAEADRAAA